MGELRLHLAMTAIEPNKLFTTFVVSRKFPNFEPDLADNIAIGYVVSILSVNS